MKTAILTLFLAVMGAWVFGQGVTVLPGAYVTVQSSAYVKITGTGNLNLKSTTDGTASLLDESGGVSLTGTGVIHAERYIAKNSWHMVSPVTTGVTARDFYWNDNPKCWLSSHSEATNAYTPNTNLNTSMPVGQGWMVWLDNAYSGAGATATMTGSLRSTNLTQTITYSGTGKGHNLVANPYPVAINWQSGTWTRTNLELTVWIWNNSTNNYLYRTTAGGGTMANGMIPQGQAFFVHANAASPALTIPADARAHSAQSFYKGSEEVSGYTNYAIINATEGQQSDAVWVSFGDNGTTGFENGWDASKRSGGETAPQLYLVESGTDLSIDHLSTLDESERIVKMFYKTGTSGVQTLTADLSHLTGTSVYLDDLQTSYTQNLRQNNTYQFSGSTGDNPDRFRLRFKSALGIPGNSQENRLIRVSGGEGKVYVFSNGIAENETGELKLFDLTGRLVMTLPLEKSSVVTIPTSLQGVLIAQVIKPSAQVRDKILIK